MNKLSQYHIIEGESGSNLKEWLSSKDYSSIFILVDELTGLHCLPVLKDAIPSIDAQVIEIRSGEQEKNLQSCEEIWNALINCQADRNSLMINLGGGVIGDMGGFAASTFKRGIDFVQIPTTLLAQVDASLGGKTGINFGQVKNVIGLFRQPEVIFLDYTYLQTLPERQLWSGFAEIIKHALISDEELWDQVRYFIPCSELEWSKIIPRAIMIKGRVVDLDPLEKGYRKILNFGHTIGHGIESLSLARDRMEVLHGEGVAAGMVCALFLSCKHLGFPETKFNEITHFLSRIYSPITLTNDDDEALLHYLVNDKKNSKSRFNFVLLEDMGKPRIDMNCTEEDIKEALCYYRDHYGV